MTTMTHTWKFFRAGGFDQVQIDSGADLLALKTLDQKLWVALSCPVNGIEFDTKTLALIDMDADGQIRANELLEAITWATALVKDADSLTKGTDKLLLSDIDDTSEEGRQLLASARLILKNLGKADADYISLAEMADIQKFVASLQFNGDGVICPRQVDDPALRTILEDIIKTTGSVADVSGDSGIDQEICDKFFSDAKHYVNWYAQCEAEPDILPLGAETQVASQILLAVKEKIDDYFVRCQMAAYDERAALPLSRSSEDFQKLSRQSLSLQNDEIADFPLATIGAGKPLPLRAGLNPAWQDKIEVLYQRVLQPLLGAQQSLTWEAWQALCARFDAFTAWQKANPAPQLDQLGIQRVREILSAGESAINDLIAQDKALAPEIAAIYSVERLIRYQRDLFKLVNNFVSFREFYSGQGKAVFQVGTLYLDGRSCELCVKVDDVNAHATFANSSGVCLVYCELVRNSGAEKMNIAAAFTAGDADFLSVGRHGIFYDRKGRDWNATIVRINDHPISIRQAFWSPYKKFVKMVEEQFQKFAARKADKVQEGMVEVAAGTSADKTPKTAFDVAKFAGIFAAIGLAIGAIGSILVSIVGGLFSLKFWQIPLAVAGLILAISLPSMALAWFKLKRRNLGPILDACGWAINARALINIPFGTSLTALPKLPENAQLSLSDPYAEKKRVWPYLFTILLLAALLAWACYTGRFD